MIVFLNQWLMIEKDITKYALCRYGREYRHWRENVLPTCLYVARPPLSRLSCMLSTPSLTACKTTRDIRKVLRLASRCTVLILHVCSSTFQIHPSDKILWAVAPPTLHTFAISFSHSPICIKRVLYILATFSSTTDGRPDMCFYCVHVVPSRKLSCHLSTSALLTDSPL